MRKFLLLIILFTTLYTVSAQTPPAGTFTRTTTRTYTLDETTVVKDSIGRILPYAEWQKLFQSGNYNLKMENNQDENSAHVIYEMSPAEKEARMLRMPPPRESGFFVNGEKIASFKASDMTGKKVQLKDLIGKVVVLNFWFINCPPCRKEIPELNKLVAQYADNPDVVFVAIALDERYDLKKFLKDNPFNYRIVDDGRYYANQYNLNLYPTNVVVDRTGVVKFNASGYALNTPWWIKKSIDESLAAK